MRAQGKASISKSRLAKKAATGAGSLEELAKRKLPKWRVVEESEQDSPLKVDADAIAPKLPSGGRARNAAIGNGLPNSDSPSRNRGRSGLVNMVPDSQQDARLGAKTQVFEDDELTGAQG